jgi:hypothetical protein
MLPFYIYFGIKYKLYSTTYNSVIAIKSL